MKNNRTVKIRVIKDQISGNEKNKEKNLRESSAKIWSAENRSGRIIKRRRISEIIALIKVGRWCCTK
jgi:hypothetical protein